MLVIFLPPPQMRQYLRNILSDIIQNDVQRFSQMYPPYIPEITQMGQQLIQAIDNPTTNVPDQIGQDHMFNPNRFSFGQVSKLILVSIVPRIIANQLIDSASEIIQAYQQLPEFQNITASGQDAAMVVINAQNFSVSAAADYKNVRRDETKLRSRMGIDMINH